MSNKLTNNNYTIIIRNEEEFNTFIQKTEGTCKSPKDLRGYVKNFAEDPKLIALCVVIGKQKNSEKFEYYGYADLNYFTNRGNVKEYGPIIEFSSPENPLLAFTSKELLEDILNDINR